MPQIQSCWICGSAIQRPKGLWSVPVRHEIAIIARLHSVQSASDGCSLPQVYVLLRSPLDPVNTSLRRRRPSAVTISARVITCRWHRTLLIRDCCSGDRIPTALHASIIPLSHSRNFRGRIAVAHFTLTSFCEQNLHTSLTQASVARWWNLW